MHTSPILSSIRRTSVREKVSYYETLCTKEEAKPTARLSVPRKFSNYKRIPAQRTASEQPRTKPWISENKENSPAENNTTKLYRTKKKLPVVEEKIQPRQTFQLETEMSCDIAPESPVECVKEEKEERNLRVELLERKVKSVRSQHRNSIKAGDIKKANNLFHELKNAEKDLAKETSSSTDGLAPPLPVPEIRENTVCQSMSELSKEISEIEFDESGLNGDLWGGIVDVMAQNYCVDVETTWRTFSSYSVSCQRDHSVLSLDQHSTLQEMFKSSEEEDIVDDDSTTSEETSRATERRNRNIFQMYDRLEDELRQSNKKLQDARGEISCFRVRLYEALHQLAKTEYQVRMFESQLLQNQTGKLEMESEIERQRIMLNEFEQQEIQREIHQLREETILRRQQVADLRKQIRCSLSLLPASEQTELLVEDPFIECSVRLLDDKRTPLQRLSILEERLSTLASHHDIRVEKERPKKKKKAPLGDLFSPPKFFSSKFRRPKGRGLFTRMGKRA